MLTNEKRDNGTSENYVQNHFGGDLRASPNSRRAPLEGGNPLKWAFPFKKTENFAYESGPPVRTLLAPEN
jgi:hypothetical protein